MKKKPRTAAEIMAALQNDPEWVAKDEERERVLRERVAEWRLAQAPLIEALAQGGWKVQSVWDLVGTKSSYPSAIPILLEHLSKPYPERVRDGIARALAVPEAHQGWPVLLDAFRREPDKIKETGMSGVKWAIALALSAAGTDEELEDVIPLLRDPSHSLNRRPLLDILARSRKPIAVSVLSELQDDKEIADDAKKALNKALRKQRKGAPKGRIH
jgi:HEAT repeat protein